MEYEAFKYSPWITSNLFHNACPLDNVPSSALTWKQRLKVQTHSHLNDSAQSEKMWTSTLKALKTTSSFWHSLSVKNLAARGRAHIRRSVEKRQFFCQHGIYYYFYQVFKNRAEVIAVANRVKGYGDGTVGMFSWLVVAALAGSGVDIGCINRTYPNQIMTHTQAERKIIETRREAMQREASEGNLIGSSTFPDHYTELDAIRPHPYGVLNAAFEVYREAGVGGFWKGLVPTLIMVCNPSIQFMIYESSLKHLKAKRSATTGGTKNVSALEVFLLGALAKLGATVSTYPLLVVKASSEAGNWGEHFVEILRYPGRNNQDDPV
ncbi:Mitochondrial substrate/solute carrier [Dillenia turbinata]|uniref:Mitochondrial substrate/solute carrier n=1 Tax=Dillenia turbinata TaxID=194707 RepID=A0AAN8V881_9MAGN